MVRAEDPLPVGEGLLTQRDRPGQVPGRLVGEGEVAAGEQGGGVVRAEDPLAVGEGLLVQGDGPGQVPDVLVGEGEVVAGGQGGGVVSAGTLDQDVASLAVTRNLWITGWFVGVATVTTRRLHAVDAGVSAARWCAR